MAKQTFDSKRYTNITISKMNCSYDYLITEKEVVECIANNICPESLQHHFDVMFTEVDSNMLQGFAAENDFSIEQLKAFFDTHIQPRFPFTKFLSAKITT